VNEAGQTAVSAIGPDGKRLWGYLVEFQTPEALLAAAERVRDAGYTRWDAHTPFPMHGLSDAMGLRPTRLPWLVFAGGLAGAALGLAMQYYTNAFDYKFLISGKPYFSLPANIPIVFELAILLAALSAFFGMIVRNGLPAWYHALFTSRRFRRTTADRFFISVEACDPRFDAEQTRAFSDGHCGWRSSRRRWPSCRRYWSPVRARFTRRARGSTWSPTWTTSPSSRRNRPAPSSRTAGRPACVSRAP
jgi:hypothetical protein